MALHLNLNHELERLRAERRRDPFKLMMLGLLFIAGLLVLQYFWKLGKTATVTSQRDSMRKEFALKEPQSKTAVTEEAELKKKLGNSERFQARIEGRFFWAPLIQTVVENVPGNIHITRLAGDVNADDSSKVQFKIEGLVAGAEPRTLAEEFRQNLVQVLEKKYRNINATFRHLEDGTETIPIEGKAAPTASFSINVQMQHGTPSAAPATAAKK
jgi:hypothetical protein